MASLNLPAISYSTSSPKVKPLPFGRAILFFAMPSLAFAVSFYWIIPALVNLGMSDFTAYMIGMVIPCAASLVAAAARLEVRGVANANFTTLKVEGGEADCLFEFSGELRRSAQGRITLPKGTLEDHVPPAIPACISVETLTGVADVEDGFTKKAGAFWNQAALAGQSPLLTLQTSVLVGTVRLRSC